MNDAIRSALAAAAPDREVTTVEDTGGSANPGNRTVRVRFADGETAYLKVAVDGDRTRLARAVAVVRYADEQTAVDVPQVLAADADADPPHLLTAPLSGTPVDEAWAGGSVDERAGLSRAVGRTLATLHERRFEAAGRIVGGDGDDGGGDRGRDGDGGDLAVETVAWPDVVAGMVGERGETDGGRFADFPARAAEAVDTHRDALALSADESDRPTLALLHNDPRPENAFRGTGDGRVGLIDWEQAMVGDPVLDIVKAEGRFLGRPDIEGRERLREALWEGYREFGGGLPAEFDLRRNVYRVGTFLGVAAGFAEWAPGVDEPTDELAGWVRSEFDERLDQLSDRCSDPVGIDTYFPACNGGPAMYVGRFVVVAPDVGAYRVSSRSFPNRKATGREAGTVTVGPTEDAPESDNPYIAYNCLQLTDRGAVLGNGSHVDPVAEKLALGYPARDALAEVLLALDFEKDDYDTPRVAGIVGVPGEDPSTRGDGPSAVIGTVRRDALLVEEVTEPTLVATYERDSPGAFDLAATDAPGAAREVYDHEFEHAVCAVGVSGSTADGFETAIVNGDD